MNGNSIFCDTNPLIYLLSGNREVEEFLTDKQVHISFITELEMFGKLNLSSDEAEIIQSLLDECFVIEMNPHIKQLVKNMKRNYRVKLPDAIIAASAMYLDMPLLTFDKGFSVIPDLNLILLEW